MPLNRRLFATAVVACSVLPLRAGAAPDTASDTLPPALAALVPAGGELVEAADVADAGISLTQQVAGHLPTGAESIEVLGGTRRYRLTFDVDASDASHVAVIAQLRHYDEAVRARGGHRLNTGFDAGNWMDVMSRMHVYTMPTPQGVVQFGLQILFEGREQDLFLFPAANASPPQASELAKRLAAFGSAPLYIHFDTNKSDIRPDARPAMAQVVALMKAQPALKLSIEGHTDNVGQDAANLVLSQARAGAVVAAVVAQGIDASRLRSTGHGASRPVADNATASGRALNRRVELVQVR